MELVFATNNMNKLDEIRSLISSSTIDLLSLFEINLNADIPEPYNTLEENAMNKASYIKSNTGYDCFADDTGLEIDALNGKPGVKSARYSGEPVDNERNIDKVLSELLNKKNRKARFRTVIALILKGKKHYFEGVVEGSITSERRGGKGFGYDPIFVPVGFDMTFAEMGKEQKNEISHRGRAIRKLIDFLNNLDNE